MVLMGLCEIARNSAVTRRLAHSCVWRVRCVKRRKCAQYRKSSRLTRFHANLSTRVIARAVIFCNLIGSLDFSTADSARTKKTLQTFAEGGVWVRDYPDRCSSVLSFSTQPPSPLPSIYSYYVAGGTHILLPRHNHTFTQTV